MYEAATRSLRTTERFLLDPPLSAQFGSAETVRWSEGSAWPLRTCKSTGDGQQIDAPCDHRRAPVSRRAGERGRVDAARSVEPEAIRFRRAHLRTGGNHLDTAAHSSGGAAHDTDRGAALRRSVLRQTKPRR